MRGKRIILFGLIGGFSAFLLCAGVGTCVAVRTWRSLPGSAITVSRDTTYLEGPLDKDGYVDYAAALNQQLSEGVAPEENAAVLLLQAFGPPFGNAEYRRKVYDLLGVEPLPSEGEYFVDDETFVSELVAEKTPDESRDAAPSMEANTVSTPSEKLYRDLEEASTRPWTAQEFPDLARWVEVNEGPLELVAEASRRPKCFLPIVLLTPEEGLISYGMWLAHMTRSAVRVLCIRATLRVGEGRRDEAWQDLLACHRLARHVSQCPMAVASLTGVAMESMVTQSETVLIHYGEPIPGQIRQILDDVNSLPPPRPLRDRINADRLQTLDSFTRLSRNLGTALEEGGDTPKSEFAKELIGMAGRAAMDWDEVLRTANRYYDALEEAVDRPTFPERREAVAALNAFINAEMERMRGFGRVVRSFASLRSPRTTMSKHIATVSVALLCSLSDMAMRADERAFTQRQMLLIALGSAAFRAEYGVYPQSLAAVHAYLTYVPVDPYSEKPFRYRLENDGFVLYSVGPNGIDEAGLNRDDPGSPEDSKADDIALHVPPLPPSDPVE